MYREGTISKEASNVLKGMAFLVIIVGHFYRFYATNYSIGVFKSIGFYGAVLFAFLSGYGITRSYEIKGFFLGGILNKVKKIYIPFLLVNVLSVLLVYGNKKSAHKTMERILLGVFCIASAAVRFGL